MYKFFKGSKTRRTRLVTHPTYIYIYRKLRNTPRFPNSNVVGAQRCSVRECSKVTFFFQRRGYAWKGREREREFRAAPNESRLSRHVLLSGDEITLRGHGCNPWMFRVSKERLALVGWNLFLGIPTSHPTTSIERKIVLMAAFSVLRYVLRRAGRRHRVLEVCLSFRDSSFLLYHSLSLSLALSSSPSFSLVASYGSSSLFPHR